MTESFLVYYLALISDESKQINFCKRALNPLSYLVTLVSWKDLLDQADQLRKSDVVIADISSVPDAGRCLLHLQQEVKLYEMEAALFLLISSSILEQLNKVKGFEDFLLVPQDENEASYKRKELSARLESLIKRQGKETHKQVIQVKELVLDLEKYEVRKAGQPLSLTFKEYELLKYLVSHPGRVFSREALLSAVWSYDYFGGTRTVDVHVRRIRAKLGDEEENYIKTIWGVGYRFADS